jgi:hypothetical protein
MIVELEDFVGGTEVPDLIVSYLGNVIDLHSLACTSKTFYEYLMKKEVFNHVFEINLEKIVKRFGFPDLNEFDSFLLKNSLTLSGSTILSALTGDLKVNPSDLDLYTTKKMSHGLNIFLSILRFRYNKTRQNGRYNGERCNSFENVSGMKIDIVKCSETVEKVINNFDLAFLKSTYNGRGTLRCLFPKTILRRECDYSLDLRIMCYAVGLTRTVLINYLKKKQDRVYKYQNRGYKIVGGNIPDYGLICKHTTLCREISRYRENRSFLDTKIAQKFAAIMKREFK